MITDQLVQLCNGDPRFLAAVVAHELGHLHHRHGMALLLKAGALGFGTSAIWGDFSGALASVPLLLGASGYSRDAEREADAFAVQLLKAMNRSPLEMVNVLEALGKSNHHDEGAPDTGSASGLLAIAFNSHPLDAKRREFFIAQAHSVP